MKKRLEILFFAVVFCCLAFAGSAQTTVAEYIELYSATAVEEMELYGIPASITLAQGILESNSGNSPLAREAKNHFGIKCHKEWTGATYFMDDDEENECFRKYKKVWESYRDHSEFLTTRERYFFLFDLEPTDYKGWAHGLKKAGYATNPRYPELLIKIIEENGLHVYDHGGSKKHQPVTRNPEPAALNPEPATQNPELKYELVGTGANDRPIFLNNGVKFILAREGDDLYLIAADFGIYTWQLFKYNDLAKDAKIRAGQMIYLEKKKKKAKFSQHIVQEGDYLHEIAQQYGVRLRSLCRMNYQKCGEKLTPGDIILLR
jgi:LysM repeat protein